MKKRDLSFIYTIAHELKSPVITIEGFLDALLKDYSSSIPPGALEYIGYIDKAVKRLKAMINDLLNLSKISRDDENTTEFPIEEVISEVLIRVKPLIKKKGIQVKISKNLPVISGKKRQIELAIENLITNAIKYIGKNNPNPQIEIGICKILDKEVFFIKDNGIGIEENYVKKIFDIFQRTPTARKEDEGTGVGY